MNEIVEQNIKNILEKNFNGVYIPRSTGLEFNTICPFCEGGRKREVTLNINIQKQVVRCWRAKCEYRSGLISFLADYLKKDYKAVKDMVYEGFSEEAILIAKIEKILHDDKKTAVQELSFEEIDVFPEECIKASEAPNAEEYADWIQYTRGYNLEEFEAQHSVYMPPQYGLMKGRVVFEVLTNNNRAYLLYAFEKGLMPKTINPNGRVLSQMLYNYNDAKDGEIILVHEGIFDCARTKSYGFSSVALFGINMSFQQAFLLKETGCQEICLCLDAGTEDKMLKIFQEFKDLWHGVRVTMVDFGDGSVKIDADSISEESLYLHLARRKVLQSGQESLNDRIKRMLV